MNSHSKSNIDIEGYDPFFQKFRKNKIPFDQHYEAWIKESGSGSKEDYIRYCFKEAYHYIIRNASTELEFQQWSLELHTKRWHFERELNGDQTNWYLKLSLIGKVMIAKYEHPSTQFHIYINSIDCCKSCSKQHGKQVQLERILKFQYLPYKSCKREDYCHCTYDLVPIT